MRKKLVWRGLAFLVVAVGGAALVNPYTRQLLFGPTYGGVPLCVWQERVRQQVLPERAETITAKIARWIQPKETQQAADKLNRDDRMQIWLSLLEDPVPVMRIRAIQALWGAGRSSVPGFNHLPVVYVREEQDWSTVIQPPCDVAPHLVRMLDDPEADVRGAAFQAVWGQGKAAAPAFPRLFELLDHRDPKRREEAATALNFTHPKTRAWLDRLIAMLDDSDAEVRAAVAAGLGSWSDRRMAVAAGPRLVQTLRDADANVRLSAAAALGNLRVHVPAAMQTVRDALRHPDAAVRRLALVSVFDGAGPILYPELAHCARADPELENRASAIQALAGCGKLGVALLIQLLRDPEQPIRDNVVNALRFLGADAQAAAHFLIVDAEQLGPQVIDALAAIGAVETIPKLIEWLDDGSLCPPAIAALRSFGPAARAAAPKLLALAQPGDSHWLDAMQALTAIAPDEDETIAALARLLQDRETQLVAAQNNIAIPPQFGDRAPAVTAALIRQLDQSDGIRLVTAVQLLGAIGPPARSAVPALLRLAEKSDAPDKEQAMRALGDIAAVPEQVVPFLIDYVGHDSHGASALAGLGNFGDHAAAAVPRVLPLLRSEHQYVRKGTADTLAKIVSRSDELVAHLLPLLRDDEDDVRADVIRLLGDLGPAARASVPALCLLLHEDSQMIYEAALDALAKIEP